MPAPSPSPASRLFEGACSGLFAASHEAMVMIDEQQRVVAMNPAAERLLGCSAADTLGQSLERFIPEPWRGPHAGQVREFAASGILQRTMASGRRVDALRADGRQVPVDIALSRVDWAGPDGPCNGLVALMRDTSEQEALREQLAAIERRMRAVFDLAPVAIWICEDDLLVYANRASVRLFGVDSIDQLLDRRLWDLLAPDSHDALRAEVRRTLEGKTAGAIVMGRLTHADGGLREVEIALAALPDHGHRTVQLVVNDVTGRRREAAELERSRHELRELSASVVEAREEERRRIARELHDELGQRLTALKIDLAGLATAARLPPRDERVAGMQAMLDDTLASVRRIASDLRPLMLDDLGLTAAIEWLARDASRRMGVPVHARLPVDEPALDQRVAIALYRMVQEALTNVARHAQARSVDIELCTDGDRLLLTVSDDGIGVDASTLQRTGSFGLMGLRERAHMLGGSIEIGGRAGGGTRLVVRLPAHPAPALGAA